MEKEKRSFEDIILLIISKLSSFVHHLLSAGDRVEEKFYKLTSSFMIFVSLAAFVLISKSSTVNIYRAKNDALEELKSVEAYYIDWKSRFKSETLNSKIMEEVKRRGIDLEQSGNPPIVID